MPSRLTAFGILSVALSALFVCDAAAQDLSPSPEITQGSNHCIYFFYFTPSKQITRTLKLLRTKAISNPVSTKKNPSLLPKRRTTRIRRKLTLRQP